VGDPVSDANHVDVPRSALGQLRGFVAGIFVGVLFLAGAAWRSELAARDAHDAAEAVEVETRRSDAERCRVTLLSREGSLEKDIRVWTRFGHAIAASDEQIAEFIAGIREDYEALPDPSDCEDG
jgi:hypothetical protein